MKDAEQWIQGVQEKGDKDYLFENRTCLRGHCLAERHKQQEGFVPRH